MTTGEGRRRPFAGIMSNNKELMEEAIRIARSGKALGMGLEIMANIGKDALCYLIGAYSQIVVLRPSHRQEDEIFKLMR